MEMLNNVVAVCQLASGSVADGCILSVSGNDSSPILYENIKKEQESLAVKRIGPLQPGSYEMKVHDLLNGSYNESEVVFHTSFTISTSTESMLACSTSPSIGKSIYMAFE